MAKLTRGDVVAWEIEGYFKEQQLNKLLEGDTAEGDKADDDAEVLSPEEAVRQAKLKESMLSEEEQKQLEKERKDFKQEFKKYSEARTDFLLEDNPTWES
jgi:hypothetical protein